jgi:acyl-CoA synthetase (AMP-forming)/AMP-acid ligase II
VDRLNTRASVPFVRLLATHGDRLAVVTDDVEVSYRELAARVGEVAARLGNERRLVLIAGANRLEVLVAYLAALYGGHVALLVPPAQSHVFTDAYDPT